MTHILHRQLRGTLPMAVGGRGIRIVDAAGKEYLDASGGAAVSCLGHGHPDVLRAMHAQIDELAYAHTRFFSTPVAEELADNLIHHAPTGMSHVYLVSGGSEAVEAALKLARQYFVEIGQPQRRHFIARKQSYHGNTLGALAVGGNEWRRRQFAPLLIDVTHVSPCYEYRDRRSDESSEVYGARLAAELDETILRLGPDSVIAFVAETVGGATAGCLPPVQGYFKRVREICDRYGILLINDEVMCGMGRTGSLHAVEQEGIVPDLMVIAKGLGGGYQPIGGVLVHDRIIEALEKGSGFFHHGHTYLGHPVACAAALAVQKVMQRDGLVDAVKVLGARLAAQLHARFDANPHIGDIRGRGLFMAIEMVEEKASKRPFDPALRLHARIMSEAMACGLMVYPMGGTVDGVSGDHVLIAPPFVCTSDEIDEIVRRLADAVGAALRNVPETTRAIA